METFYSYKKEKKPRRFLDAHLTSVAVAVDGTRQVLPCNPATRQSQLSALYPAAVSTPLPVPLPHPLRRAAGLESQTSGPVSARFALLWQMLHAGTVENFLDLKTHITNFVVVVAARIRCFLFSSPTSEGALEFMSVFR